MHVLILNWKDIKNPDVGGAEIILYELAKRLVKEGHTVTWFCRTFPKGEQDETIDGVHIVRRGNRFTVYWEAYRYYRSLTVKPDKVLDCVNTICWQTPLYVPRGQRIAYINQLAKEVLYYELPPILSSIAYMLEPLEYLTYKQTQFVCYSDSVRTDLGTFGIPNEHIQSFQIGIDHARYTPGIKSRTPLFLFVARLARMKRPDLCIRAMQIVIKRFPKARLAIVGYGPMEKKLQREIIRTRLSGNVVLVNRDALYFDIHPKDRKTKLMVQSWALLLPSVKEGWGMVVTEAAACGTPAIVSDVTGLRDSVIHGKTGMVLPRKVSAESLADVMMRIIENQTFRKDLSKQALHFSQQFTWERAYHTFTRAIGIQK